MASPDPDAIAILGGTGDQGLGLALRFAKAGRPVVIGSRVEERAVAAAEQIRKTVPDAVVSGFENSLATPRAEVVINAGRRMARSRRTRRKGGRSPQRRSVELEERLVMP